MGSQAMPGEMFSSSFINDFWVNIIDTNAIMRDLGADKRGLKMWRPQINSALIVDHEDIGTDIEVRAWDFMAKYQPYNFKGLPAINPYGLTLQGMALRYEPPQEGVPFIIEGINKRSADGKGVVWVSPKSLPRYLSPNDVRISEFAHPTMLDRYNIYRALRPAWEKFQASTADDEVRWL